MSRYEWTDATAPIDCIPTEELCSSGIGWVLVLGDHEATALVIEGDRDQLLTFSGRLRIAVLSTFSAEHENGLHLRDYESRCPLCCAELTAGEQL
jgi:hypothetical protein